MGRKPKPLPFKKGMKVICLTNCYDKISIQEAIVSMVTTKDGQPIVYTRTPDHWGGYFKHSFSTVAGTFQTDPNPIWKLMPQNGKNMKNLEKRAKRANKLYQQYQDRHRAISVDVERDARQWQNDELDRRTKDLPNGGPFLRNVVARMGFKKPKDGVKVRTRKGGEIVIVK